MININNIKLTKEEILTHISQEQIFSIYLELYYSFKLTIEQIVYMANNKILIESPIRSNTQDSNPSLGFKYKNIRGKNKLRMRDFGGYFWGDCFDFVAYTLNIDINNADNFSTILRHIVSSINEDKVIVENKKVIINNRTKISIKTRDWNDKDKAYWRRGLVTISDLNNEYVYPVEKYYIDGVESPYKHSNKYPCYAYYLGKDNSDISLWKLYFPNTDGIGNNRFKCNSNILEGLLNIKHSDNLIFTKSYKDVVTMRKVIKEYHNEIDCQVLALPSESARLSKDIYNKLISYYGFKNIFTLLDFDMIGRKTTKYMIDTFNTKPLFFTNGILGTSNYKAKDFFEYVCSNNIYVINKNIKNWYNYIKNKYGI